MNKKYLMIGVILLVLVVGFFGWQYISFASLKSKCQAIIDSKKIEVEVNFKKAIDLNEVGKIKDIFLGITGISSFEFTSEEKALEDFKEKHKEDSIVEQALPDLVEDGFIQSYASIKVDAKSNLNYLLRQIKEKELEGGFTVSNFFPDGSVSGARNMLSVLSFDFPFGDSKRTNVLKNCVKEGLGGFLKAIFQES